MSKPDQLYLSDDMQPPPDPAKDEAIEKALDAWLEAKVQQQRAATDAKTAHTVFIALCAEKGVERYPYVDRVTGKKRYAVVARDPKVKTIKAPTVKGERRKAKRARDQAERDDEVEVRRVSRESVEREIGPTDPFAGVREQMGVQP